MSELKKGDSVMAIGAVISIDTDGTSRILWDGEHESFGAAWVPNDALIPLTGDLKVGDTVRIGEEGRTTKVCSVDYRPAYRLDRPNGREGTELFRGGELEVAPPKPEFTVEYKDDSVTLLRDGKVHETVSMSHPYNIICDVFRRWGHSCDGVDEAELHELTNATVVIDSIENDRISIKAIRACKSWCAYIDHKSAGGTFAEQLSLTGKEARKLFPGIRGDYDQQ